MSKQSRESRDNEYFEWLKEVAHLENLFSKWVNAAREKEELLKQWILTYISEKEAERKAYNQNQKTLEPMPQRKEFIEKIKTVYETLKNALDDFIQRVTAAAATATKAAGQTVNAVLAKKGIKPNAPTAIAAHQFAQNAYHVPTLMQAAKGILKAPTPTPGKRVPVTVSSVEDILKGAHHSQHERLKTARTNLIDSLERKMAHDEFVRHFVNLNTCMAHSQALHHTCSTHPEADHNVLVEAVESIFDSLAHAEFLEEISKATAKIFKQFEAVTAEAAHEVTDLLAGWCRFPPTPKPSHREEATETAEHTHRTPFKTKPKPTEHD